MPFAAWCAMVGATKGVSGGMAEDGAEVRTYPVNPLNDVLFKYLFAA